LGLEIKEGKSSHYGLNMLGYTRVTGVKTMSRILKSINSKNHLGSDRLLKLVNVKQKSLVIVN